MNMQNKRIFTGGDNNKKKRGKKEEVIIVGSPSRTGEPAVNNNNGIPVETEFNQNTSTTVQIYITLISL